ncbi:SDR family NAD(P)-dependent oxidoreductase [Derxia gummosa]|uniref:SDR family NAD(P)-dependent oxidoreductase n=1 Tax=Derxia gummosa DSM 723 TaxID=1121388 RepID=A0A8B6X3L7_9BURK|nr:glucose 1-dehydrogenase [Derxia gummosa]
MTAPAFAGITGDELAGKVVMVTGASRGIGRTLALGLAAAGARVGLAARSADGLAETAAAIETAGGSCLAVTLDVTDHAAVAGAFARVAERFGGFDALVNNAGAEQVCASLDVDEAIWDRIVDTNLKAPFFCAQAAARLMLERSPANADAGCAGSIVNIGSVASMLGIPTAVPYCASKHGVLGLTRALAAEWAPLGLRVNAIGPGYFRTAMTDAFYEAPGWQAAMLPKIPAGRFGRLDDLAGAAVFLCGDGARYINGQILYVDGGLTGAL